MTYLRNIVHEWKDSCNVTTEDTVNVTVSLRTGSIAPQAMLVNPCYACILTPLPAPPACSPRAYVCKVSC